MADLSISFFLFFILQLFAHSGLIAKKLIYKYIFLELDYSK